MDNEKGVWFCKKCNSKDIYIRYGVWYHANTDEFHKKDDDPVLGFYCEDCKSGFGFEIR